MVFHLGDNEEPMQQMTYREKALPLAVPRPRAVMRIHLGDNEEPEQQMTHRENAFPLVVPRPRAVMPIYLPDGDLVWQRTMLDRKSVV
jgi:hypothetical protein